MKASYSIFTFFALLIAGCSKPGSDPIHAVKDNISSDEVTFTSAQEESAKITTGRIEERLVSSRIKVSGKLEAPPQNLVTISTPFAGFVKST